MPAPSGRWCAARMPPLDRREQLLDAALGIIIRDVDWEECAAAAEVQNRDPADGRPPGRAREFARPSSTCARGRGSRTDVAVTVSVVRPSFVWVAPPASSSPRPCSAPSAEPTGGAFSVGPRETAGGRRVPHLATRRIRSPSGVSGAASAWAGGPPGRGAGRSPDRTKESRAQYAPSPPLGCRESHDARSSSVARVPPTRPPCRCLSQGGSGSARGRMRWFSVWRAHSEPRHRLADLRGQSRALDSAGP